MSAAREPRERDTGPERRLIAAGSLRVERRAAGDGPGRPRIVGHAAVFDRWTTLYEGRYWTWREVVRPGAFRRAIAARQDVRALLNHDPNYVLGRSTAGTLTLSEDSIGLLSETDPPDTQTVRDLVLTPIERGDISGMSFAFGVHKGDGSRVVEEKDGVVTITTPGERVTIREDGDRTIEERELLDLDLFDVSPVTYPAYDDTDVSLRSFCSAREAEIRSLIDGRPDQPRRSHTPRRDRAARLLRLASAE